MPRRPFVAGNWKMHGSLAGNAALAAAAREVAERFADVDVAVCVPAPYLAQLQGLLAGSRVGLGGQNLSEHALGAYTGEVSAAMLAEFGCRYVIVGHSERRTLYGETDERIAAKLAAALAGGLTPIFCIGESLEQRDGGRTEQVVLSQLNAAVDRIGQRAFTDVVVAYEPVWAIGTGRNATP